MEEYLYHSAKEIFLGRGIQLRQSGTTVASRHSWFEYALNPSLCAKGQKTRGLGGLQHPGVGKTLLKSAIVEQKIGQKLDTIFVTMDFYQQSP